MKKRTLIATAIAVSVSLPAFAWTPFTVTTNVCDTCKQEPADVVTLASGGKIRGQVVGENPAFYVVVVFTEARAIPRNEVQGIEWANGTKPAVVSNSDQILLKNGVVFSGTIVDDKTTPPVMQLKSSFLDQTYMVFKAEVQEAYRSGVKVDLGV
jgi:hypothetical protein